MLKKKIWRMCTNFWINPHNGKLPSRLAPAQYQNSLTPQLLSNIYWSKTKTSISLNRVYWYDTMCHIFSCLEFAWPEVWSHKTRNCPIVTLTKDAWVTQILTANDLMVNHLSRRMTKPTKWHVRPAKTQISLGICPVWKESSLCAKLVVKNPRFLHADSEDWSDWAHNSFCLFYRVVAHFSILTPSTWLAWLKMSEMFLKCC